MDYLRVQAWSLIWAAGFHFLAAIFNLSDFSRFITDMTSSTFGFYVGIVYIQKGIELLLLEYEPAPLDNATGWLSVTIAILFFISVYLVSAVGKTSYLTFQLRTLVASFAFAAGCIFWTAFSHFPKYSLERVPIERLPITPSFFPTMDRAWLVDFWNIEAKWAFVGAPLGFLITLLFWFDHNVSSIMAQARQFPVKRPAGFHWDFFLLGVTTLVAGILGLPAPNGLVPQCPWHTEALSVFKQVKIEKINDDEEASEENVVPSPGKVRGQPALPAREHIVNTRVAEQRGSHLLIGVLTLVTMTRPFLIALGTMPRAVFAGIFLLVGWGSIERNIIMSRTLAVLRDRALSPPGDPLNQIRKRKIAFFVGIQWFFFATTFAISQTIAGIGFPVLITLLIPFRYWVVPRLFSPLELRILDAPTTDAEVVLASIGHESERCTGQGVKIAADTKIAGTEYHDDENNCGRPEFNFDEVETSDVQPYSLGDEDTVGAATSIPTNQGVQGGVRANVSAFRRSPSVDETAIRYEVDEVAFLEIPEELTSHPKKGRKSFLARLISRSNHSADSTASTASEGSKNPTRAGAIGDAADLLAMPPSTELVSGLPAARDTVASKSQRISNKAAMITLSGLPAAREAFSVSARVQDTTNADETPQSPLTESTGPAATAAAVPSLCAAAGGAGPVGAGAGAVQSPLGKEDRAEDAKGSTEPAAVSKAATVSGTSSSASTEGTSPQLTALLANNVASMALAAVQASRDESQSSSEATSSEINAGKTTAEIAAVADVAGGTAAANLAMAEGKQQPDEVHKHVAARQAAAETLDKAEERQRAIEQEKKDKKLMAARAKEQQALEKKQAHEAKKMLKEQEKKKRASEKELAKKAEEDKRREAALLKEKQKKGEEEAKIQAAKRKQEVEDAKRRKKEEAAAAAAAAAAAGKARKEKAAEERKQREEGTRKEKEAKAAEKAKQEEEARKKKEREAAERTKQQQEAKKLKQATKARREGEEAADTVASATVRAEREAREADEKRSAGENKTKDRQAEAEAPVGAAVAAAVAAAAKTEKDSHGPKAAIAEEQRKAGAVHQETEAHIEGDQTSRKAEKTAATTQAKQQAEQAANESQGAEEEAKDRNKQTEAAAAGAITASTLATTPAERDGDAPKTKLTEERRQGRAAHKKIEKAQQELALTLQETEKCSQETERAQKEVEKGGEKQKAELIEVKDAAETQRLEEEAAAAAAVATGAAIAEAERKKKAPREREEKVPKEAAEKEPKESKERLRKENEEQSERQVEETTHREAKEITIWNAADKLRKEGEEKDRQEAKAKVKGDIETATAPAVAPALKKEEGQQARAKPDAKAQVNKNAYRDANNEDIGEINDGQLACLAAAVASGKETAHHGEQSKEPASGEATVAPTSAQETSDAASQTPREAQQGASSVEAASSGSFFKRVFSSRRMSKLAKQDVKSSKNSENAPVPSSELEKDEPRKTALSSVFEQNAAADPFSEEPASDQAKSEPAFVKTGGSRLLTSGTTLVPAQGDSETEADIVTKRKQEEEETPKSSSNTVAPGASVPAPVTVLKTDADAATSSKTAKTRDQTVATPIIAGLSAASGAGEPTSASISRSKADKSSRFGHIFSAGLPGAQTHGKKSVDSSGQASDVDHGSTLPQSFAKESCRSAEEASATPRSKKDSSSGGHRFEETLTEETRQIEQDGKLFVEHVNPRFAKAPGGKVNAVQWRK